LPKWNKVEPVKSLEDNHYTEGEIMGDHRCENCGKMFYTRYVQHKGNCFCQECSAKLGVAKKEKEYREAKEYWEARKK
jgi:formylmethanofuran dehydrogenase subunit E